LVKSRRSEKLTDNSNWGVDGVSNSDSLGSVESVGGISNNSGVSSEGLALGGGSVLSLVGLAH